MSKHLLGRQNQKKPCKQSELVSLLLEGWQELLMNIPI